ncbi:MAG TPA: hypothetical protein VM140_05105 [Burkholderiales bacterium]|nr:hypothetical protein [Burkholderiales bacterium]
MKKTIALLVAAILGLGAVPLSFGQSDDKAEKKKPTRAEVREQRRAERDEKRAERREKREAAREAKRNRNKSAAPEAVEKK